jgi:hypothetical protein
MLTSATSPQRSEEISPGIVGSGAEPPGWAGRANRTDSQAGPPPAERVLDPGDHPDRGSAGRGWLR